MGHSEITLRVRRPLSVTFDYVGTHMRENHPSWEPEVLEIRPITAGPMGVGTRATMVRKDMGKVHETTYEVVAFEPGRRVAIRHADGPMDFALEILFAAAGPDEPDITARADATPHGKLRLVAPILNIYGRRTTKRIAGDMVRAIEGHTTSGTTGQAMPIIAG